MRPRSLWSSDAPRLLFRVRLERSPRPDVELVRAFPLSRAAGAEFLRSVRLGRFGRTGRCRRPGRFGHTGRRQARTSRACRCPSRAGRSKACARNPRELCNPRSNPCAAPQVPDRRAHASCTSRARITVGAFSRAVGVGRAFEPSFDAFGIIKIGDCV